MLGSGNASPVGLSVCRKPPNSTGPMTSETVTIERLGHRGDGIAAGPIYAARTLPGEVVTGAIDGDRIHKPSILTPSTDRVSPACRHYKSCGGCALMHARDDFVAGWKQTIVREALAANGIDVTIRRIHTSPPGSRRRAVFSGKRTKSGAIVGFHAPQSDTVIAVPDCRVITETLKDAIPFLERLVVAGGSRKAELKLAATDTDDGIDLAVTGGHALDVALRLTLSEIVGRSPIARLTWNGDPVLQKTQPMVRFAEIAVPFPPGAFLQATHAGEAALRTAVSEALGPKVRSVVDLFAGTGTFSLPAARTAEVHAVEGDAALTEALLAGWRHAEGLKKVTVETRDLFRRPLLPDELKRFDAAIIDPPRAGAEAQISEIAKAGLPIVAHVSCNPITFARDAATLIRAGYSLNWVDVVDQFRWSSHTELVSSFQLNRT